MTRQMNTQFVIDVNGMMLRWSSVKQLLKPMVFSVIFTSDGLVYIFNITFPEVFLFYYP